MPTRIAKEHHGREYLVAFVSLGGEFAGVKYGIEWLAWLAALFLWLALISYTRKYFKDVLWLRYSHRVFAAAVIVTATYFLR
jgi:hypothetical protein